MDKFDLTSIKKLLGIYEPWSIKQVKPDLKNRTYHIFIEAKDQNRLFGLIDTSKKFREEKLIKGSWLYMPIGRFKCMIHADIQKDNIDMSVPISSTILEQPAFLGHPTRNYSNFLRQKVVLTDNRGDDASILSDLLQVDVKTTTEILNDLKHATNKVKSLAFLPTEVDSIWEDILFDRKEIKTDFLPLKLFLSKQKKLALRHQDILDKNITTDLRKFFFVNAHQLDSEVDQLCNLNANQQKRTAVKQRAQQRLVLPAIKNTLWIDLLNNKLNLHSQSVPLNLLISRQRLVFMQAKSAEDKIKSIEVIRNYIRINYKKLKTELVLLNRAMDIKKNSQISLPNPDHKVWQNILSDNDYIPSNNMAYKLLLASLRVQITNKNEPNVKLAAATRVRDFIEQNKKSMRQELGVLLQQSRAV